MQKVQLGHSDLHVTPICLGTMTFGEQVDEPTAHAILDRSLERGVDFIDTAEMYAVPARRETYGATETILGHWFDARPGVRGKQRQRPPVQHPLRRVPLLDVQVDPVHGVRGPGQSRHDGDDHGQHDSCGAQCNPRSGQPLSSIFGWLTARPSSCSRRTCR